MQRKKLFLIDAYAIIFRAYYAFINRPITNSKGLNTSAIFGFVNSIEEILTKEGPTHISVVFDPPGPTFRKELYKEYKANRSATPDDIKLSIPYIKDIVKAYNIPIHEVEGYEADDVIGTIANIAAQDNFEVYMMTPDKDYGQLVDHNIFMYKPRRSGDNAEILGVDEILEKYQIERPNQVIDILALAGDASDNVPGAPGVGEKTAIKLIHQFNSIEQLLESTAQLKGKQKENIENNKEQIQLSKELVTICTNVDGAYDLELMQIKEKDTKKLKELFDELEFKNLSKRIIGDVTNTNEPAQGNLFETVESSTNKHDKSKCKYVLLNDRDGLNKLKQSIENEEYICLDTETTSLNVYEAKLLGIAVAVKENEAYYIDVQKLQKNDLTAFFESVFAVGDKTIVGHNIKYDLQILHQHGYKFSNKLFDTMVAHYLLNVNGKHKLDEVAKEVLNYEMIPITDLIGPKGKDQKTMEAVPVEVVTNYACEDADITLQLYKILYKQLKDKELIELASNIEMPLVQVLTHVEMAGFKINSEALKDYEKKLQEELNTIESNIYEMAGEEFNIASPKQLGIVLFEKLKVTTQVTLTKSKQYSTSEETLAKLKNSHPIVDSILEYRSLSKLISTYVSALPKMVQQTTGKIHTSFNQTIAATGRLSSINPNLQNIPIREERGREIRKSFIASEGNVLLAADYSQIELRIMAHLSGDENMIEAFYQGEDIHKATAAKVFKVATGDVTREMRSSAKTANFGIIYGISAFGLAQRLTISRTDAKSLIDNYFETFPKVKVYMDKCIEDAKRTGYVTTLFGRKRPLPEINSANANIRGFASRNAINSPIQGTAADIIKLAMTHIYQAMIEKNLQSKMILQVHDELIFDCVPNEVDYLKQLVKEKMEGVIQLSVPLTVDMGTGDNWMQAH